jgi:adenylate cyclase
MGALLGLVTAVALVFLSPLLRGVYQDFENKTYDLRFDMHVSVKADRQPIDDVVIIDIDEASIKQLGRFQQWPRYYHARLIDYLKQGGAAAVGFDIFFTESDSIRPEIVGLYQDLRSGMVGSAVERATGRSLSEARARMVTAEWMQQLGFDEEFARSVREAGMVYFAFPFPTNLTGGTSDEALRRFSLPVGPQAAAASAYAGGWKIQDVIPPLGKLVQGAGGVGFANIVPDLDGVVRSTPLFLSYGGHTYPSLGLAIARGLLGQQGRELTVALGRHLRLGHREIPIDRTGSMLIRYVGTYGSFRYLSYSDVLSHRVPAEYFRDKAVLVGTSAAGLSDLRSVPFAKTYPGVEIHANVIYGILHDLFVRRPALWVTVITLLGLGTITGVAAFSLRPVRGALLIVGLLLSYLVVADVLFETQALWLEVIRPVGAVFLAYLVATVYRYVTEEREKRWIKGAFQHYVSASVVNEIVKNPGSLKLGGERRDFTVLFSDIRGFTTLSEEMDPQDLVHFLNDYLTAMSEIILRYKGMLDKYVGDEIMAVYGAPLPQPDHAERACRTALGMMDELRRLHGKWKAENRPLVNHGIGINTGIMSVGNMGSRIKFDYTAIGDNVNLGARLEGTNKEYGTNIIISESTYEQTKGKIAVRELDLVAVKGRAKPVAIYELLGMGELAPGMRKVVPLSHQGLAAYRARQWDQAEAFFGNVLELRPEDGPAKVFLNRCAELRANPPEADWDFVYTMKTK